MYGKREQLVWTVAAAASAALLAVGVRKAAEFGWTRAFGREPPQNPAARGVDWADALAWSAAAGLAAGMARVVGRRGAAAAWYRVTGKQAPTQ